MHHFFDEMSGSVAADGMDMSPAGTGRLLVSLAVLALLAGLAWLTMDAGRYRALTLVLLAFFAFRVMLTRLRSR